MFCARWCDCVRQHERESCDSGGVWRFRISEHESLIALTQCSVSPGLFSKWAVAVYHTNPAQHRYRLAAVCTLIKPNKSVHSWATAGQTRLILLTPAGRSREVVRCRDLFVCLQQDLKEWSCTRSHINTIFICLVAIFVFDCRDCKKARENNISSCVIVLFGKIMFSV